MSDEKQAVEPQQQAVEQQPAPAATENTEGKESLKDLGAEKLVDMLLETRTEAKNRRLELKEVKQQISELTTAQEQAKQAELEKKQEWEKLYNEQKEKTSDYEDLKLFKDNYLNDCKAQVEKKLETLTDAQKKLFELGTKDKSADIQLKFIQELAGAVETKPTPSTDNTQASGRAAIKAPAGPAVPFAGENTLMGGLMKGLREAPSVNSSN